MAPRKWYINTLVLTLLIGVLTFFSSSIYGEEDVDDQVEGHDWFLNHGAVMLIIDQTMGLLHMPILLPPISMVIPLKHLRQ